LQKWKAEYFCFGGLTRFLQIRSDLPDGEKSLKSFDKFAWLRNDRRLAAHPDIGRRMTASSGLADLPSCQRGANISHGTGS
jgi:hypothetical protein